MYVSCPLLNEFAPVELNVILYVHCTYSNVDKESNDTCYNDDALKNRRCNFSDDDGSIKEYHSGRLGTYIYIDISPYHDTLGSDTV